MRLLTQINIGRRFMWWPPWGCTHWYRLWIWRGGDEWCNDSICLDVPLTGCFIFFWRRHLRTMPCDREWAGMDDEQRADYMPGGYLEGGRVHPDRTPAWERADL